MLTQPFVLVAVSDHAVSESLCHHLRHHNFQPVCAYDADAARDVVEKALPDVVLLDWDIGGEAGLDLLKQWRSNPAARSLPIIMTSSLPDEKVRIQGLDCGADEFVTRPFLPKEFMARIRAVLRRRSPITVVEKVDMGGLTLETTTHRAFFHGKALDLSLTEFKLLLHFMMNPERLQTRGQILDALWGADAVVGERTVDAHLKRLRVSLGNASHLIETVRGIGYIFNPYSFKTAPKPVAPVVSKPVLSKTSARRYGRKAGAPEMMRL